MAEDPPLSSFLAPLVMPVSNVERLQPHQWEVIRALADIAIPSIPRSSNANATPSIRPPLPADSSPGRGDNPQGIVAPSDYAEWYLGEALSSLDGFQEFIERLLSQYIHPEGRRGILLILNALSSRAGSLLLTGSATPLHRQPYEVRETIFQGMRNSRLPPLRLVSRVLLLVFKKAWTTLSPSIPAVLRLSTASSVHLKRAEGTVYDFLQFPPAAANNNERESVVSIETDVVIVGSGCGGSVAAKNLAEAGYRVVVVEKSYYFPTSAFPIPPLEGNLNLYESGGFLATDDGNMAVLVGSSWGGGGTINWSASLAPQGYLREEWAAGPHGLNLFTSHAFQASIDQLWESLVLSAAQKLGYNAKAVPQNTGNGKHFCGHCHLRCASAMKKGPRETFLADAAQSGATFIEGFEAHKIILQPSPDRGHGEVLASGIEGTWISRAFHFGQAQEKGPSVRRRVEIRSNTVIVACGSLQSPLLLRRSGLRNPHIGRHLYLHPVLASVAVFDRDVRPWEGSALTTVISDWENMDGKGHGVKIETPAMLPSTVLPLLPWRSGAEFKDLASKMGRMAGLICLCRDRDSGRVYPDPTDGRCRIEYATSAFDKKHLVEGLIACAKIACVSGATEYHTTSSQIPPLYFSRKAPAQNEADDTTSPRPQDDLNNEALRERIATVRSLAPLKNEKAVFASAHQMGSCCMGTSPQHSVVDADARVWGTRGLYVCDASIFPSASGVNPMIANMALADCISRRITVVLRERLTANPRPNL
ncbi:hypothetical protein BJY04DRAFT_227667 [Aspergillus karnatakaensis]|uniref:uncharacterized protein n=1 Tax=Aspergillus karnatakaensis TaxID=1810916 RepID=UPI003CCE10CF